MVPVYKKRRTPWKTGLGYIARPANFECTTHPEFSHVPEATDCCYTGNRLVEIIGTRKVAPDDVEW